MTTGRIIKIVLGAIILLGGVGNIPGIFQMPNAAQATGYFAATFLFIVVGCFLLYSDLRKKPVTPSILGDE